MTFEEACATLGVPWDPERVKNDSFPWDGEIMCGKHGERKKQDVEHLWHELAHWLIADPSRRSLADFGITGKDAGDEEGQASALGIWMHGSLGEDQEGARRHEYEHSWAGPALRKFWKKRGKNPGLCRAIAILEAAGLKVTDITWDS